MFKTHQRSTSPTPSMLHRGGSEYTPVNAINDETRDGVAEPGDAPSSAFQRRQWRRRRSG